MINGKWTVDVATEGAIVQNETNIAFADPKLLKKVERPTRKVLKHVSRMYYRSCSRS